MLISTVTDLRPGFGQISERGHAVDIVIPVPVYTADLTEVGIESQKGQQGMHGGAVRRILHRARGSIL